MHSVFIFGGSGEIRTHGELPHACFQDKCLKPLGHTSLFLAQVPAHQLDHCIIILVFFPVYVTGYEL